MGGNKNDQILLTNTLMFIVKLLNDNNINNWFIAYGTLLGIIRNNSCIDGDDDVDIVIDRNNYDILKKILIENDIEIEPEFDKDPRRYILKTKVNKNYCSVDFYMAYIDEKGNFKDPWENVIWSECYNEKNELIQHIWNDNILYLPLNYEIKLINRYGESWRIPQNTKGPLPRKTIL